MDYKRIDTTFRSDFTIADVFGIDAIEDTYDRSFNNFKWDIKYMTELSMVLNHKIRDRYKKDKKFAQKYQDLWTKLDDYIFEYFTWDDINFYYHITD